MYKDMCKTCKNKLCAGTVDIFASLSKEELRKIVVRTGHEEYSRGDMIFYEGKKANTLYIINEGKIKLYKHTKDGKEQILHILTIGDFFGELNLFNEGEYTFNAKAMTDVKLCTLKKDDMKKIILEIPEIALKILEVVGERLSKLETLVQKLASNDIESRLAHLVLEFKKQYGKKVSQGVEIVLPLTREDMSNFTGVARETVSRKLKKFEEEGIIKLIGSKKIILLDERKLELYV